MKRFFLQALVCIVFVAPITVPVLTHAQNIDCNQANSTGFVPLACYAGSPGFNNAFNSNSLGAYINNIFKILISVGGILAVLRIAYAGYQYMGSGDMWGNKQKAKEILADAVIGLLLLLGVYLVLNTIDPNIVNFSNNKLLQKSSTSVNTSSTAAHAAAPQATTGFGN